MSTQAPYPRPTYEGACPLCGRALVRQEERLVCSARPGCPGWRPLPLHLVKADRGEPRLPGF